MKFFWKIFFVFTALITLVFSVFGIWMITQSFHRSLVKEVEEGNRENRMYQFVFEVNLNSLAENYRTEKVVAELAEAVIGNLSNQQYAYRLYKENGELLYTNSEVFLEHGMMEQMGDNTCVYQVMGVGNSKYLVFLCKSVNDGRTYYLESAKDISDLYLDRESFFDQYRVVMLVLVASAGFIVLLLSHFLTRSVVELSYVTKKFAEGDYQVRAVVESEDEIGTLARDFNQMADSLTQKMDELKETARKQEDFTASFAHELKTPLTSIIGYADMLRTMDLDYQETVEAANYIYSQGKRLESLSFKLLELIITGNQEYQFRAVSMPELVDEVLRLMETNLEKKRIQCEVNVAEGTIHGERDLLISLLVNLMDNARKALGEGGSIWVDGRQTKEGYELEIRDNGCGMQEEELGKITEAFYMVDKSRSRKEGGAGLGMTLCSRIVELHGAKWYVDSAVGEGTTIRVVFAGKEALNAE